jgi:SAM-dependent methyltransferase
MSVPRIFDRQTYATRRARARAQQSFLVEDVGENLAARLGSVNRRFRHGLDLTTRNQSFDLFAPLAEHWTRTALTLNDDGIAVADEETLPFDSESFDLVVSALSLHAVNDLPGVLAQIRRVLQPDGLFLAALFGGNTLNELRASFAAGEAEISGGVSPRVAPFADVRDLGGLLQRAGFALPVSDSEKRVVRYRAFTTLIDDLRALGETNALAERSQKFLRRDVLAATLAHYGEQHADPEGRLRATFEVVYLTAWAPDESQPKPLRPGSAKSRLAEALGTAEQSAGERADPKFESE